MSGFLVVARKDIHPVDIKLNISKYYYVTPSPNMRILLLYVRRRGDRGWLTSFAPKVRFSKNCIIFANYYSVHTF